jgi:hypothetical protein
MAHNEGRDCPLCDELTKVIDSYKETMVPDQEAWEKALSTPFPTVSCRIKPPLWDMYVLWASLKKKKPD